MFGSSLGSIRSKFERSIWESTWGHSGVIMESNWGRFRESVVNFDSIWDHFSDRFRRHFGFTLGPFLDRVGPYKQDKTWRSSVISRFRVFRSRFFTEAVSGAFWVSKWSQNRTKNDAQNGSTFEGHFGSILEPKWPDFPVGAKPT